MAQSPRDRGQAAISAVFVVAAVFAAVVSSIVTVADRVVERTRAQTAADAVALVSLDGGRAAAQRMAGRHGATIQSWSSGPHVVTVVVVLGDATATARASNEP